MNSKELLTIEFRYHDKPRSEHYSGYANKTITVGIFDTLEEAIDEGNKALDILSKSFEVREDDKFKLKHLYLFGCPKRLVTNTCYPTKGIQYFAQITELKFDDLNETVNETFKALERYKEHKYLEEQDD
jgi:hypothetical protein